VTAQDWFGFLPKVELHLHLEGAIPYSVLWELVRKYGGDPAVPSLDALKERFVFRDFLHFLETWGWKNGFIREYDDFTLIAEAVARDLLSQNVRYAELFCTPSDFRSRKLETQKIIAAIRRGYDMVPGLKLNIIVDFCRNYGVENAVRNLDEVTEVKNLGVLGFTIGGAEKGYPPEPFAAVYEEARRRGFHTTAHAGEADGPASVWGALRALKVERIGHGTRIFEDPALLDYVVEHQIPLEVCPVSNVKTRVVNSLKDHPVRRYFEAGAVVTVNTDDPKMFGNSLSEEYRTLHHELGFTLDDIRQVILNGVRSSWLPEKEKLVLEKSFITDPAWALPEQKV
jgi:adenosine deaminase